MCGGGSVRCVGGSARCVGVMEVCGDSAGTLNKGSNMDTVHLIELTP